MSRDDPPASASKPGGPTVLRGSPRNGRVLPRASALASHWHLDPAVVFLNHGSFGACPSVVLEKQRELRGLMEAEPVRFFVELADGMLDRAHGFVARLVNADVGGVARVENATAGVSTVVRSLEFKPGDELLTNTHEYNACNNALAWAAEKWGARVVRAEPPFPTRGGEEFVQSVLGAITDRTRLVLISHITSPTGVIVPVERVVDECNRRDIDALVDGAHAPGLIPIDIARLNPAYYTGNLHKWLCAPKGAAFLWVREDRRDRIRPLVISHGANSARTDVPRFRQEFDYTGTSDITAYLCVEAAAGFLSGLAPGGLAALAAHNRAMALKARDVLCAALGVEPPAPDSMLAAMAAVELPMPPGGRIPPSRRGYHDGLQDALVERHAIQVPIVPFPPGPTGAAGSQRLVRVSVQAYNSPEQAEYLAECLREELRREGAGG